MKKLTLTIAVILLLCVGVITVYAVSQPALEEKDLLQEGSKILDELVLSQDHQFYARCMKKASADQKTELQALADSANDMVTYKRKALQIIGQLPEDQPRLTREDIKNLKELRDVEFLQACNSIAGAPDYEFLGSGMHRTEYYLDAEGKEKLVIWVGLPLLIQTGEDGTQTWIAVDEM